MLPQWYMWFFVPACTELGILAHLFPLHLIYRIEEIST